MIARMILWERSLDWQRVAEIPRSGVGSKAGGRGGVILYEAKGVRRAESSLNGGQAYELLHLSDLPFEY